MRGGGITKLVAGAAVLVATLAALAGGVVGYQGWLAGRPLPDVSGVDHQGRPAALSDFRGRWVVVFFGYTHCPDVCPSGLSNLARVLRDLGLEARTIQGLFVTLDPARDTPAVLGRYLAFYDTRLAGLRIPEASLDAFTRPFGLLYSRPDPRDGAVDHPGFFYVVSPGGALTEGPILPPLTAAKFRARVAATSRMGSAK